MAEEIDVDALNSVINKGEEDTKDEIPPEVVESMKAFDAKVDSDDDSAIEDTEEVADGEIPAEKKAEDEIPAKKEVKKEVPAKDEDVEAEIAKIEKQSTVKEEKPEEKPEEKAEEKDKDDTYDAGLDPEEFDEDFIKVVNGMGQKFTDEIKVLKSEKSDLANLVQVQEFRRHTDWLDRKINGLGDDFVEIYGEGEFDDIEPASEYFENRAKLDNRIALTAKAYKNMGRPVPSRNKLFDHAVSYLHKDIVNKSKTEEETVKKLAERRGQVIGRASNKGSTTSALERSAESMKAFDKKVEED